MAVKNCRENWKSRPNEGMLISCFNKKSLHMYTLTMFVILISISPRFGVPYRELEFSGFGESRFMAFSFSLFHFYPFLKIKLLGTRAPYIVMHWRGLKMKQSSLCTWGLEAWAPNSAQSPAQSIGIGLRFRSLVLFLIRRSDLEITTHLIMWIYSRHMS